MTTTYIEDVQCVLCGKSSQHRGIGSTNAFGSADLDTRPPEMRRSTISTWVQKCPECGYCARRIDEAPAVAKAVIASHEYRNQLTSQDYPELANAFLCLRMVSENAGSLSDAAWASIHAAWACDDSAENAAASKCRGEAARLIHALHDHGQTLAEQTGADEAFLTDLLRRAGRFEEALGVVDRSLPQIEDKFIQTVLLFQKGLISKGNVAAHRIKENALAPDCFEPSPCVRSRDEKQSRHAASGNSSHTTEPVLNPDPQHLVWMKPGTFTMGAPPPTEKDGYFGEGPQRQVTISQGFWMSKYETTQEEYQTVVGTNPSRHTGDLKRPVENVSWYDATNFCDKLTARERDAGRLPAGYEYRLPTEAEWEYACRAGTTTRFSYGDDPSFTELGEYAWYNSNSGDTPHPVGLKKPNAWGLYDMHGNVWEWCLDWYGPYPGGSETDPRGPNTGSSNAIRGGCWDFEGAGGCSAVREGFRPICRWNFVGFRPVLGHVS